MSFSATQDKATKDHQIRNLQDEVAHQQELIAKLNKEKKQLQVSWRGALRIGDLFDVF